MRTLVTLFAFAVISVGCGGGEKSKDKSTSASATSTKTTTSKKEVSVTDETKATPTDGEEAADVESANVDDSAADDEADQFQGEEYVPGEEPVGLEEGEDQVEGENPSKEASIDSTEVSANNDNQVSSNEGAEGSVSPEVSDKSLSDDTVQLDPETAEEIGEQAPSSTGQYVLALLRDNKLTIMSFISSIALAAQVWNKYKAG